MKISRVLVCGIASMIAFGCDRQPAPTSAPAAAPKPKIVATKIEKRPVERKIDQPGTVQASEETVLYSKIGGYVRSLALDPAKASGPPHDRFIDIGSRVKTGQPLVELAAPEFEEELKQKQAFVRQAEAEIAQAHKAFAAAQAGVRAAQAQVTEAKAGLTRANALYDRWRSEAERVGRLVSGGVMDAQSRDETQNQFKAAEATRAEATAKVASGEAAVAKAVADADKSEADVKAAEARVDVASADARRTAALLAYAQVKAPYDGVITRRSANTGDYVTTDAKVALFAVAKVDPVRVVVQIPEADAGLVEVGLALRVSLPTSVGSAVGKVARTSWSLEPGSRTLRAEADLPNPDGKLRPGMYVVAHLTATLPAAWAVPADAVGKFNDAPVAYLVENGKAVRVEVALLRGDSQWTQLQRYKKPGGSWIEVTGAESFAGPAGALTDGQPIE